jgi:hypothetical protein
MSIFTQSASRRSGKASTTGRRHVPGPPFGSDAGLLELALEERDLAVLVARASLDDPPLAHGATEGQVDPKQA